MRGVLQKLMNWLTSIAPLNKHQIQSYCMSQKRYLVMVYMSNFFKNNKCKIYTVSTGQLSGCQNLHQNFMIGYIQFEKSKLGSDTSTLGAAIAFDTCLLQPLVFILPPTSGRVDHPPPPHTHTHAYNTTTTPPSSYLPASDRYISLLT